MRPIRTFNVVPYLPPALERQRDLVYNLRWTWNHDAIELFRWASDLWEESGHNPVRMLGMVDQARLDAAAADEGFLANLERVARDFDAYMARETTWFRKTHGRVDGPLVAYFSAEFGITDCLSIFAGGLGILAGDHLKSASDLGVPLVGVGLLYQQGYFRQYLNEAGWQQEAYDDNDFYNLPLTLAQGPDGTPLTIEVPYPGRAVRAQIWRAQVGRVPLYLVDTNIPSNGYDDQNITDQLYGGDVEMRIKQEIMLGIGGYRALEALKLAPSVYHMNEGHSAFLGLERIRRLMEIHGLSFAEAREAASSGLVFTTHTPVEAGHDYFTPDLIDRYFTDYARSLGLSRRDFLGLGRRDPNNDQEPFCMTVLALRLAPYSNGVSRLHAQVSRRMWQSLWPGVPEDEIPIVHITNGVHFQSWISREMDELYDRYLGPRWSEEPADQALWARAVRIPAEELWRTHERRRERLVAFARRRLREQLMRRGAPRAEVAAAEEFLRHDALTIGFARRFATYKRATLLLRDRDRLARILTDPARPVQFIFGGRAHPRDDAGKELIRQIVEVSRQEPFRGRLVFLEGYDMAMARYLVGGADVWLNNPRRPLEASGTSGMKAAANGVLNLSTLDGWWAEAWDGSFMEGNDHAEHSPLLHPLWTEPIGWAIGQGESYDDPNYQDQVEADALYELLEQDVIPTFYDRGSDGLPRRWIARMKASIATLCFYFNTHRMVRDYTERFYLPAASHYQELTAEGMHRAKALAAWRARVQENWPQVRVERIETGGLGQLEVNTPVRVRAVVRLGKLTPEDVAVEFYLGRVSARGEIVDARAVPMQPFVPHGTDKDANAYIFEASDITCSQSGLHGYTVRVRPQHPDQVTWSPPGLCVWAGPEVVVS